MHSRSFCQKKIAKPNRYQNRVSGGGDEICGPLVVADVAARRRGELEWNMDVLQDSVSLRNFQLVPTVNARSRR